MKPGDEYRVEVTKSQNGAWWVARIVDTRTEETSVIPDVYGDPKLFFTRWGATRAARRCARYVSRRLNRDRTAHQPRGDWA